MGVFFVLGFFVSANATVLYSNIADGNNGALNVGNLSGTETDWANEFVTASGSAVSLTDVEVVLGQLTGTTDTVTAFLYSNNSGKPNASLATLGTVTPPAAAVETFTPSSVILQPSTQYWIVLVNNHGGFFAGWQTATSAAGVGVTGEAHAFWTGAAWSNEPDATFNGTIPLMQVDVGAAPEPATFGLMGAAIAGLALFGSRRSR
jgi:PEP-CTERM motif-containing protein